MTAAAVPAEAVGESLRAAAVRRSPLVAVALDPEQALARARAWGARAVPEATVEAVRVRSVLYRPDGSCSLRYLVRLSSSRRERILLVHVPATGTDIAVRAFPADPGLPTLGSALDPVLMRSVLGRVVPGTGGERAIGGCTVDVVRYPRAERCVLRYRLSIGSGGAGELRHPVVFGKVHGEPGAASAAAAALRLLRGGLRVLPGRLRIDVPQPLAVVPPLRLGLTEAIPGEPVLPDLLKRSCDAGGGADPRLSEALAAAARAAAAVHGCDPASSLPVRDLAAERAAVAADLVGLEPVWPGVAAYLHRRVADALESVGDGRGTGWPVVPVLAHGDLTPGQVLLDGSGRPGLVDVDTVCVAEPALDLGRFLAYLHVAGLRRSAAAWPLLADLSAAFVETYLDEHVPSAHAAGAEQDARRLLLARTAAYRALALARLGASACRQLKDERLGAVVDLLDGGDEWMRNGAG